MKGFGASKFVPISRPKAVITELREMDEDGEANSKGDLDDKRPF